MLLSTIDTVDWDTPAALATSVMVGRRTGIGAGLREVTAGTGKVDGKPRW